MRAHSRGGVLFVATCNLCGFTCRVGWASCMRVGSVLSFLGEFSPAPLCVAAWPSRWQGRAQVWGAARLLCRGLHPFCMGPRALHILWRLAALLSPSLPSIPAWQLRVSWRRVALPCVGHPQVQLQTRPSAPSVQCPPLVGSCMAGGCTPVRAAPQQAGLGAGLRVSHCVCGVCELCPCVLVVPDLLHLVRMACLHMTGCTQPARPAATAPTRLQHAPLLLPGCMAIQTFCPGHAAAGCGIQQQPQMQDAALLKSVGLWRAHRPRAGLAVESMSGQCMGTPPTGGSSQALYCGRCMRHWRHIHWQVLARCQYRRVRCVGVRGAAVVV